MLSLSEQGTQCSVNSLPFPSLYRQCVYRSMLATATREPITSSRPSRQQTPHVVVLPHRALYMAPAACQGWSWKERVFWKTMLGPLRLLTLPPLSQARDRPSFHGFRRPGSYCPNLRTPGRLPSGVYAARSVLVAYGAFRNPLEVSSSQGNERSSQPWLQLRDMRSRPLT